MLIKVKNLLDIDSSDTFLSAPITAGSGSIPVKNVNNFFTNWAVQIGKTGNAQSEIKIVTGFTNGTSMTLSGTLTYSHNTDDPVYAIKYDKIIFKRSTSGTAGTVSAITNGTVTITPNNEYTTFDDTTGASTYAYKAAFYNSTTTETSSDSDWIVPSGYTFYSLNQLRERTKSKLFSAKFIKNDSIIDEWLNEWLEYLTNTAITVNQDYSLGTVDITIGTQTFGAIGTITNNDFKQLHRVWFTTNGNTYYNAGFKKVNEYEPDEVFVESHPYYFLLGDNLLGKLPATPGTARCIYYKIPSRLTNESDELPFSLRSYTKSFTEYALAQALYMDKQVAEADRHMASANNDAQKFLSEITPRSQTGISTIQIVAPISDNDDYWSFI